MQDEELKSGGGGKEEKLSWRLQDGGSRRKAREGVNGGGKVGKMMESWMGGSPGTVSMFYQVLHTKQGTYSN